MKQWWLTDHKVESHKGIYYSEWKALPIDGHIVCAPGTPVVVEKAEYDKLKQRITELEQAIEYVNLRGQNG